MTGGHLNYASSGTVDGWPVLNPGLPAYLYISPDVTASPGFQTGTIQPRLGTAVLSGGTATVKNPWLTADTRIFLSNTLAGGTPGFVYVSARTDPTVVTGDGGTAGTPGSFTITSSSSTDTSRIAWMIVSSAG
jgi:hypothetical protein